MADTSGAKPLTNPWLALAMLLGVSGMAGWAGRYADWKGAFAYGDAIYKQIASGPIAAATHAAWPGFLLEYPEWLADYIIICLGLFVLVNITWRNNMGRTLIADSFRDSGPVGGSIFLAFTFILTPAVLPLVLLIYDSLSHEGKTQVRVQLGCYGIMAAITGCMAAVNFLLKLL
jgi:hypothetical protein